MPNLNIGIKKYQKKTSTFLFIRNAIVEDENYRYYSDSNGFGNIVQRTNKATGEQQVYDYWTDGKMRKLTKYEQVPNSTTTMEVDYYFDALGRRVAKKFKTRSNEFTNTYTYLANQDKILLAKSGDNKVQLQVDGQGIDEHWAQINKSGIKTYISDHLGTVINSEVTNDSKITGAFGEVLQAAPEMEATTNPLIYGYTGRQFEPETGLYFYRNRVYDQNSGRFLTKDPIGFQGGDANLYRYCQNTPLNCIDPDGKFGITVTGTGNLFAGAFGGEAGAGVAINFSRENGIEVAPVAVAIGQRGIGLDAGFNINTTFSFNTNSINDLAGGSIGGSLQIGAIGGGVSFSEGTQGQTVSNFTFSVSPDPLLGASASFDTGGTTLLNQQNSCPAR